MLSFDKITSLQNPRIKGVMELLEKSRERRLQQLFVVEGLREIQLAMTSGYRIDALYFCPEIGNAANFILSLPKEIRTTPVNAEVFAKMAYREHSEGVLAVFHAEKLSMDDIQLSKNPFVLILEAVEKPGNLGAILRTADAAKVDAVIVCDPSCDIYNPNVIRSGIGCVFTQQIAVCTSQEALDWLKQHRISIYATELKAAQWYHETDMTKAAAIVMGAEADGLSDFWLANADVRIKIPMRGKIDSLNVSVSTAVIVFEAMRQRNFN